MITIKFDTSKLTNLVPILDKQSQEALRLTISKLAFEVHRNLVIESPIGKGRNAGKLSRAWQVKKVKDTTYEITNDTPYLRYLIEGTGLYDPRGSHYIRIFPKPPKKVLHWVDASGEDVFVKYVLHNPGIKPRDFPFKAIEATEGRIDEFIDTSFREAGLT